MLLYIFPRACPSELLTYFVLYRKISGFNSSRNDKIVDQSKLKVFADDKINVTQKIKFVSGSLENVVGEGENAGYQLNPLHLNHLCQKDNLTKENQKNFARKQPTFIAETKERC